MNGPFVSGPFVNGLFVNGPFVSGLFVNGPFVSGLFRERTAAARFEEAGTPRRGQSQP